MVFYFKYLKHKDTNTLTNTQIPPLRPASAPKYLSASPL